jgi:hypothetical protein
MTVDVCTAFCVGNPEPLAKREILHSLTSVVFERGVPIGGANPLVLRHVRKAARREQNNPSGLA